MPLVSLHMYNGATARSCRGRKRWILSVPVKGALLLDAGAVRAIRDRAKSLFSAGIVKVVGDFAAQDAVSLCDEDGAEFGRGLCNYRHDEVARVQVGTAGGWSGYLADCLPAKTCSREHGMGAGVQAGTVDVGKVDCPVVCSHSMR